MLDLYKLQIFAVVVQEGSFSAAAERLYMTQSAISQHIKDLESSLGQTLFQRGWRGVKPTAQGEILADYARQIFALVAQAETALTNAQRLTSGKVSIGTTPGIAVYLAPDWVELFRARYPQLSVTLQTGVTAQIVADVLAHHLDIGMIEGELDAFHQARLEYRVLQEVEQVVVVGQKHAFWTAESLQLTDLHRKWFIMRQPNSQTRIWLERTLKQHHVEPAVGAEFDNLESIKRSVMTGTCLTILPPYTIQNEIAQNMLRAVPIEGRPLRRSLKLIWDREVHFSPITRAFLEEISSLYPALEALLKTEHGIA